ncbi:hypothetical protein [Exiguobacterium sp. AB2]|uniref:hypothetical protein n=1 Tax=Exiguobacterium sp. AB2 TaxID=1484479 RepID=UPI0004A956AB|nr:hypothetical protein [Exiguobacterium sp. AB2]KDN58727.1 hypothetical protein DI14_09660 [Exiguobacterium sp. AB2]
MRRRISIIVIATIFLLSGCDGIDKFGANADHAAEEAERGMEGRAEAFEYEEEQYQEYLEMVEELDYLREKNEELEEEIFNLTEYRDTREDAYEYFCEYGYDEISEATYNELCQY